MVKLMPDLPSGKDIGLIRDFYAGLLKSHKGLFSSEVAYFLETTIKVLDWYINTAGQAKP